MMQVKSKLAKVNSFPLEFFKLRRKSFGLFLFRGWPFDLGGGGSGGWGGMGDLFKNIILQTVFEGKNCARKYLGKKISCPEKNIPHQETISTNRLLPSWRIMMLGKKSYTVICRGNNSVSEQVLKIVGNSGESEFHLQFYWNRKLGIIFCPGEFGHIFQSRS